MLQKYLPLHELKTLGGMKTMNRTITGYTCTLLAGYSLEIDNLTCLIPPTIGGDAYHALREGQEKLPHPRLVCDGIMTTDRRELYDI